MIGHKLRTVLRNVKPRSAGRGFFICSYLFFHLEARRDKTVPIGPPELHLSLCLLIFPMRRSFPIDPFHQNHSPTMERSSQAAFLPVHPTRGLFEAVGRHVLNFLEHLGRYVSLVWWAIRNLRTARETPRVFLDQMIQIGNNSIPIVIFVCTFVGMVTAVQSAYQLYAWIPRAVVGALVIKSVLLELTPLLTALVLAGKVGATITAEIGSMRVTEQVDALEAMGYDSVSYLITPRVVAGMVMFPVLVVFGDLLATLGGLFGGVALAHVPAGAFLNGVKGSFATWDVTYGLIKATFFGYTITSIACYRGYHVKGGSAGVGEATMGTVVLTCLIIVLLDLILASVLL
jgi:phospholipid/cholesterol/gamma-HCH transport system permease protein